MVDFAFTFSRDLTSMQYFSCYVNPVGWQVTVRVVCTCYTKFIAMDMEVTNVAGVV